MDMKTGQAFVFDVGSFYGHNEYDTGNWRAPRHKLSNEAYIKEYKRRFPVSQPEKDWDARNLLYSLTFNIGNTIYIPGSSQKQVVYDDMTRLCKMFCDADLREGLKGVGGSNCDYECADAKDEEDDQEKKEGEEKEGEEKEGEEKGEKEEKAGKGIIVKSEEADVEKAGYNDRHGELGNKEE